jgi:hypothetical protein
MPFWEPGDEPATAAPASQMLVDPAKILQLKKRLEDRRLILQERLRGSRGAVFVGRAPGTDPRSESNAEAFTSNGQAAAEATNGFIDALSATIESLQSTAAAYGLVEETNTDRFRYMERK